MEFGGLGSMDCDEEKKSGQSFLFVILGAQAYPRVAKHQEQKLKEDVDI